MGVWVVIVDLLYIDSCRCNWAKKISIDSSLFAQREQRLSLATAAAGAITRAIAASAFAWIVLDYGKFVHEGNLLSKKYSYLELARKTGRCLGRRQIPIRP